MTEFLQLALALAIIIFTAKLGGYASYRLGQPSVMVCWIELHHRVMRIVDQ